MSQRMLRRIVTVGALAALLALSLPAPADARELGALGGMLRWLNDFWESGVSALWPSAPADRPITKEGPGIDPNGKPVPDPAIPSGTSCGVACEQGLGLDPNG